MGRCVIVGWVCGVCVGVGGCNMYIVSNPFHLHFLKQIPTQIVRTQRAVTQ